MIKWCALGILTVALLSACGDDVTRTVAGEPQGLEIAADVDSLPRCDVKNIGGMFLIPKKEEVYVCLDSGWKSLTPNVKGHSCMTEMLPDSSGCKIVCDGDSLGVVSNGKNGEDGETGDAGEDGVEGKACHSADNGDGSFWQICGEDSVMLYKAFCRDVFYDPDSAFCDSRNMRLYRMVRIGEQVWMAENLNYSGYKTYVRDSTSGKSGWGCLFSSGADGSGRFLLGVCYEKNGEYCEKFGRLYTNREIETLCPAGWHMPDSTEWKSLFAFVAENGGGNVGGSLRSVNGWSKNILATDEFGFGALPGGFMEEHFDKQGYCIESRDFYRISIEARFLSAEGGYFVFDSYDALDTFSDGVRYVENEGITKGSSVRCIRDDG